MVDPPLQPAPWQRQMASMVESTDANLRRHASSVANKPSAMVHTPLAHQQRQQPLTATYGSAVQP